MEPNQYPDIDPYDLECGDWSRFGLIGPAPVRTGDPRCWDCGAEVVADGMQCPNCRDLHVDELEQLR